MPAPCLCNIGKIDQVIRFFRIIPRSHLFPFSMTGTLASPCWNGASCRHLQNGTCKFDHSRDLLALKEKKEKEARARLLATCPTSKTVTRQEQTNQNKTPNPTREVWIRSHDEPLLTTNTDWPSLSLVKASKKEKKKETSVPATDFSVELEVTIEEVQGHFVTIQVDIFSGTLTPPVLFPDTPDEFFMSHPCVNMQVLELRLNDLLLVRA